MTGAAKGISETMTARDFIAKWKQVELKERSAAQEHFIDLCRLLGHPTPAESDPTGESFCFERGVSKHGGGDGFADVWKKGFFGWEYKGKHKDLNAAYNQLLLYRDALASPPLLVLCDLERIIIHTNFTNTASARHEIALTEIGEPRSLEILRAVFFSPDKLRPGQTSEAVTRLAAERIGESAESMRKRDLDAEAVAHFLDRVVFCMFAEDIGLLPAAIFTRIAQTAANDPARFCQLVGSLFNAMSTGGDFGLDRIRHFNGSLFDHADVPVLTADEVSRIVSAVSMDWSAVDPTIFGTLFERGLDPAKRSQLGAHFTGREDILLLVNAVIMDPLRKEWAETRETVSCLLETGKKKRDDKSEKRELSASALKKAQMESSSLLHGYLTRLQSVKVLDPACGSGNFLYVTLQALKDLEKEVIVFSMDNGLGSFIPLVGPWQLYGIELNPYAHDLAQMTVWIGWLQWLKFNGFGSPQEPILRAIPANFQCRDSIMSVRDTGEVLEPDWPAVDFIVGNPPFLGSRFMRGELGNEYCKNLYQLYEARLKGRPDLCCYWFEKACAHVANGKCKRVGLLATQSIRGGTNREVLKRIKENGDIFWAISDRDWIQDGAMVHVSMIAFDNGLESRRHLDGLPVSVINANLTAASDTTAATGLIENKNIAFQGNIKRGSFDVSSEVAYDLLKNCGNPHGLGNSDVLFPYVNASDISANNRGVWIIDFARKTEKEAKYYERPFKHIQTVVYPERMATEDADAIKTWWMHWRTRPELTELLGNLQRFIATPRVSKHRVFRWINAPIYPDCAIVAFVRDDDYFFGILHSRLHEVWTLAQGTQLREKESGFRYTPTTCFETFPFPVASEEQKNVIGAVAKELNALRENWLNPPEWTRTETLEFLGTVGGPWDRYIDPATVEDRGTFKVGTVRYPRLVPRDEACAMRLKDRTLTKLYNVRPQWLADCHARLDAAVAASYGFPPDLSDEQILSRLLELNHERARQS
jgi:hypothetical protein